VILPLVRPEPRGLARSSAAEDGPTAVEYAVMLPPIGGDRIAAITTVGTKPSGTHTTTGNTIPVNIANGR
jgi:Flp pilus assembly pilin Flp